MKQLLCVLGLSATLFVSGQAVAGAQQDKMKGCNIEAKEQSLKGDERKAFMSKCLKKDYELKASTVAQIKSGDAKPAEEKKAEAKKEVKKAAEEKKAAAPEKAAKTAEAAKADKPAKPAETAKTEKDAKPADAAKSAQQDKMKTCNADAKSKKLEGEERKKFMSTCLKG